MIDKLDAARQQIECAIRLVAANEDELAVHTLVMAAYGILEDLAKGNFFYEAGIKPELTKIGKTRLRGVAAYLKHADRDPEAMIQPIEPPDNDWRVGFCLLLYQELNGKFTPTMAAFHNWMILRHPDEFMIAEDPDVEFEHAYRQAMDLLRESGRETETVLLDALLRAYQDGVIPPDIGFDRRRGSHRCN